MGYWAKAPFVVHTFNIEFTPKTQVKKLKG